MPGSRSVITFATNKLSYTRFALNCARSILLHNDIPIYIVSNLDFKVPGELQKNVSIIRPKEGHAELGIGMKLYMDEYLQTERSLFIDSDCLCFADLGPVFSVFEGKNVSVAGTIVDAAEWVGPQQAITIEKEFRIKKLPRFNGGMYYLKKNLKTGEIFDFARSVIPNYDNFGFQRINNKWINEEGPIAISMIIHHETPVPDNGNYMTDLFTDPHPSKLNVLTGERVLKNPAAGQSKHRPWYPAGTFSPIIIHFGGQKLNTFPYLSQNALLWLRGFHINKNLCTWVINLGLNLPYRVIAATLSFVRKLKTRLTSFTSTSKTGK